MNSLRTAKHPSDIVPTAMKNQHRRLVAGALALACWTASVALPGAASHSTRTLNAAETNVAEKATVPEERLLQDIKVLADDQMEGRGVGTKGLDLAADYVRTEFEKAGLNVTAVNGGAYHTFKMSTAAKLATGNTAVLKGPDGKVTELTVGTDYTPVSIGGEGAVSGEIVFVGYGISDEKLGYDDYAGLDVKGKVVLMFRKTPQQGKADGKFTGRGGRPGQVGGLTDKFRTAAEKGAAAVLLVNDPYSGREELAENKKRMGRQAEVVAVAAEEFEAAPADKPELVAATRKALTEQVGRYSKVKAEVAAGETDPLVRFGYGGNEAERPAPMLHISRKSAETMVKATLGKTLTELETAIDADLKPQSAPLTGWTVEANVAIERTSTELKNVVGILEATGPLADETLVIGAHYDHVGRGAMGSRSPGTNEIHNGADDNGSGTVCLIEMARRLAARKGELKRRVVFIAFTAEEIGLIGSARYCREPVFPLDKTVAMLNMDMVGRLSDNKLTIAGTGTAPIWKDMLEKYGKEYGFQLGMEPQGFGPSDHSSFYSKKIPVLHFFTGLHEDYHRPADDWDKINVAGMARITDMVEKVAMDVNTAAERPAYIEIQGSASLGQADRGTQNPRPYFGSIPDYASGKKGYALDGVASGGPADKAGLKSGDVIIKINDSAIESVEDFDRVLRKFKPDDVIQVQVQRGNETPTLPLTLGRPRG